MKKSVIIVIFFTLFLFRSNSLFATHIIGGDISVTWVSGNNFMLTVTLFRDISSGVPFDNSINVGLYDKVTNGYAGYFTLPSPATTTLTLGDACYTPPSLHIAKGVYSLQVNIPNNSNGYYVSFNRCCRNGSIVNISSPGSEGYVAYCEMPDPALHNSSPVFTTNPTGYMCENFLNSSSGFEATDVDGDVLTYSFSKPLSCSATGICSPLNTIPNPPAPGPYGTITWGTGYSTTKPFGDPAMSINASTGVISCTPPNSGIYVLCVTVTETRAGVKIGEIRRDFQYEVLNTCSILNISAAPTTTLCNGSTITLSAEGKSGFTYLWSPGGETTSAITITPAISTILTVTATSGACVSTASVSVTINPKPTASITKTGNICIGETQTLAASGGTSYNWSTGASTSSMSTAIAGTYTVWVTNTYNCTSAPATGNIAAPVTATKYTWTGTQSTNWFDSRNWDLNNTCIPSCAKDVDIPNVVNDPVIGPGVAACRNINLSASSLLTFSNSASELDICGDFTNTNATVSASLGTIKFSGSAAQNYSSSIAGDFHNVILANTAVPPLVTVKEGANYQDLSLNNTGIFTFQTGILKVEGNRKLVIKNTASGAITGQSVNGYVNGQLKRYVVNSTAYDFPVGGVPGSGAGISYPYELMNVAFTSISGLSTLTAYFDNPDNNTGNETGNGLPIAEQTGNYTELINNGGPTTGSGAGSKAGVWTILPDAGTATYDATFYGRNFSNDVGAGAYYSVLKRPTYSTCGSVPNWTLNGSVYTSSLSGNIITTSRTDVSGFSQFAQAKHSTILPVGLMEFSARCDDNVTTIKWKTGTEINNNYFTVERRNDGTNFERLVSIPGAGNSSTIRYYTYTDPDPLSGTSYYRLSQTDYNGATKTFAPVATNCQGANDSFNIKVNGNPVTGDNINISVIGALDGNTLFILTDVFGREVYSKAIVHEDENFIITLTPNKKLDRGIYFVTATSRGKLQSKKIAIK